MKKYVSPDYEIEKFTIESVLTSSGIGGDGNNEVDGGNGGDSGFDFL